ncbi:dTDP-4-dehydrorhamnose reductase [Boseongicola aestuarii]|uniref:dTDP-4-dehydrorhamnose reductase n=1 Tax=Boseongicola aestuarii TaxID=1470561 RepID=A0A238J0M4_9RHOB|nr:dTDP-4-dehydrorhamnose reductase [Boseongicola aestuarii]SMX23454.1 dTDP-4-dehydrorhamnose reductase [Boseongicola aestuarii]
MKIALFGKTGQVATEIQRRAPKGVIVQAIGRNRADFALASTVAQVALDVDADVIINAAAYTAVDKAENEADLANLVNHLSVAALAQTAAKRAIPLIHISTDYVFDGSGELPRTPDAPTGPLGIYGRTKRAGEEAILAENGPSVILRTSWVFSAHGSNFVKTMLRLGRERDKLSIVADQIGGPTSAAAIADAVLAIAAQLGNGSKTGIYHFSGAPDASWASFAREIFRQSKLDVSVNEILTSDYPTPAKRPLNSRLSCDSLAREFGIQRPDWRDDLTTVLEELGAI